MFCYIGVRTGMDEKEPLSESSPAVPVVGSSLATVSASRALRHLRLSSVGLKV